MIGCLRTRVRNQPIIALYFEFENELITSGPVVYWKSLTDTLTNSDDRDESIAERSIPSGFVQFVS